MSVPNEKLIDNRAIHRLDYSHLPWEHSDRIPVLHEAKRTLYLHVNKAAVPEHVVKYIENAAQEPEETKRVVYEPKDEPYIALIGSPQGHEIRNRLVAVESKSGPEVRDALLDELDSLVKRADFSFRLLPCFYKIQRPYPLPTPDRPTEEVRTSIVQLAQVKGLSLFYRELNWALGLRLKTPPAYITLFAHSTNSSTTKDGISVPTEEAFKDWVCESIPPLWQPRIQ